MVSTTDDHVGRVLDHLEKHGLREKTIVVLMSDNGHSTEEIAIRVDDHVTGMKKGTNYGANGGGGNTGKWIGNKGTMLEGGLRVPAMISFPGTLPQGEVRDQAITAMDWMPTILELCGVMAPAVKFDGASIVPIIKSADAPSHYQEIYWQWGDRWAVRQGDWKLQGRGPKALTLHSLAGDEPEQVNFLNDHPERVAKLTQLHLRWVKEVMPE